MYFLKEANLHKIKLQNFRIREFRDGMSTSPDRIVLQYFTTCQCLLR